MLRGEFLRFAQRRKFTLKADLKTPRIFVIGKAKNRGRAADYDMGVDEKSGGFDVDHLAVDEINGQARNDILSGLQQQ